MWGAGVSFRKMHECVKNMVSVEEMYHVLGNGAEILDTSLRSAS